MELHFQIIETNFLCHFGAINKSPLIKQLFAIDVYPMRRNSALSTNKGGIIIGIIETHPSLDICKFRKSLKSDHGLITTKW